MRDCFDKYLSLVEITDFNTLIDNKPFFWSARKNRLEAYGNLPKCEEMMAIQQKIC